MLALVLLAVVVLAVAPQPVVPFGSSNDKLNHVAAFSVISLLACFAFPHVRPSSILTALLAFNAMIEVAQALMMNGREADMLDFAVGAFAAIIVVCGFAMLRGYVDGTPGPD
jgi:hypothetical protein